MLTFKHTHLSKLIKSTEKHVAIELVRSFKDLCSVFRSVKVTLNGSRNLAISVLILILNLLPIWSSTRQHPYLPVPMETHF